MLVNLAEMLKDGAITLKIRKRGKGSLFIRKTKLSSINREKGWNQNMITVARAQKSRLQLIHVRTLNPPSRKGKIAWHHHWSERLHCMKRLRQDRKLWLNGQWYGFNTECSTVQSWWIILQLLRKLRKRWSSTSGSSNKTNLSWIVATLSKREDKNSLKKFSSHQSGEPNSSKPVTLLISEGNSGKVGSPEGQNNSHFDQFKCSPKSGPRHVN